MRAAWDIVKFRVNLEHCDGVPAAGDEMRTRTGRRYQILRLVGRTVTCMVLPLDAEVQGRIWNWTWENRRC